MSSQVDSESVNSQADAALRRLQAYLQRTIIGQNILIERLLISLLTGGHLLIEGLPGLAKTTAVRNLARGLSMDFRRIQFTPDMIPGDITGTEIFQPQQGRFHFVAGPLFNEIILADEINRAPPKVQSALLEAMQEGQITISGTSRALPEVFIVIATQNPIEHEGTYPLPEAQLDRFMMKTRLDYPGPEEELRILKIADNAAAVATQGIMDASEVLATREQIRRIYLDEMLERYIVTLVGATRNPQPWDENLAPYLEWGASPRATLALARAARARALLNGRDFVTPDDIMVLAYDILNHRIGMSFAAAADNVTVAQVIERILEKIPIP